MTSYDVVVPTTGRESLPRLLEALLGELRAPQAGSASRRPVRPGRVIVVDDRRSTDPPLALPPAVEPVRGPARGPAAARNAGLREAQAEWVVFLDDDVVPPAGWRGALEADLRAAGRRVAAVQGRIEVPLPADRRPTDWERNVAALGGARWATADMALRRAALHTVGGFDERFRRAYREDSDLGLRLTAAGFEIGLGCRRILHPVRPADRWVSLRLQAGNADDALMAKLHGRGWRARAGAPRGRLARHLATTAAGLGGVGALALGRRRTAARFLGAWLGGTAELAWARIAPGPRTAGEVRLMCWTSVLLPAVASGHWLRGQLRARRLVREPGLKPLAPGEHYPEHELGQQHGLDAPALAQEPGPKLRRVPSPPEAVLVDRDGTLIEDLPYCGDPELVRPLPGVRAGLERLRARGTALAVISNQSGIARGLLTERELAAVNARVEQLLGPLGPWFICPHGPEDGCRCRKPLPGLIEQAAARLGVSPRRCAVIGDIGADVKAALAAGARPMLVPTERTRREEILAAPEVASSFAEAVEKLLGTPAPPPRHDQLLEEAVL